MNPIFAVAAKRGLDGAPFSRAGIDCYASAQAVRWPAKPSVLSMPDAVSVAVKFWEYKEQQGRDPNNSGNGVRFASIASGIRTAP